MGNKFENCDTCDYANDRYWFGGVACGDRFNLEDGECSGNGYPNWSLRRDKRECDNCSHPNKYRTEEFHCYRSYEYGCVNWISKPITEEKPETYKCIMHKGYLCPVLNPNYNKQMCDLCDDYFKEEKQMKEYTPTSKCTLKNIAHFIDHDGCNEARKIFGDIILKHIVGYNVPSSKDIIKKDSLIWEAMMSSRENFHWLKDNGFIEEEIILKPCPFCGSKDVDSENEDFVVCNACKTCGPECETEQAAIKAWNTSKQ